MQGLNSILGTKSHLKVLRVLQRAEEPLTGREIQRQAGLSNRAAMLALESLTEQRILRVEVTASKYLYHINRRHFLWAKAVRPALEGEEGFWEDVRKLVMRSVKPRPEAAMATGPLARDESSEEGVLDLHLLFTTGRQRLQAYQCLERIRKRVEDRYGLEVNVTFMDKRNMDDPEFMNLWKRIAREGVLLFGKLP
jgi:hypothetical protein